MAGAIRDYDGQVDDARLVINLARTAASLGAAVVTSARVVGFVREAREVVGVRVRDLESPGSPEFEVRARTVVAATGDRLLVTTGSTMLRITEIQSEGSRPMSARAFLAGHAMSAGDRLTTSP